ncbi:MAG: hypothetical protein AAGH15_11495 [Myxococcota bacterium]
MKHQGTAGLSAPQDEYWAAVQDREEFGGYLEARIRRYYDDLERTGRSEVWKRATNIFYGRDSEGGWKSSAAITHGGEQGELALIAANEFRSLLTHTLVLVIGSRPGFQCRAMNNQVKSREQADLAEGLLEWSMDEYGIEAKTEEGMAKVLRYGDADLEVVWDHSLGAPYTAEFARDQETGEEHGRIIRQGDIRATLYHPIDVARDPSATRKEDVTWKAMRRRLNRWDVAAEHPEHREAILGAPADPLPGSHLLNEHAQREDPDRVSVWEFYHDRTPALPQGRHCRMVGDTIIYDGALRYQRIPVISFCPEPEEGTPFGSSSSWDLMGLQDAVDAALGAVLTNHENAAVMNYWTPPGSGLEVTQLAGGMNLLESDEEPRALNHLEIKAESFQFIELLTQTMQRIRGLSDFARGNVQGSSGEHAALLHSMTMQYNSGLQRGYGEALREIGQHLIELWQEFATTERTAEIAGADKIPLLRSFKGSDIAEVRRVAVDIGEASAMSKPQRIAFADRLLQAGVIEKPEDYLQVVSTGRLEHILDPADSHRRGIDRENELLLRGQAAEVMITDNHLGHVAAHASLLDEPAVRADPDAVEIILAHCRRHFDVWRKASHDDPDMLLVAGRNAYGPNKPHPMHPAVLAMAQQAAAGMPGANPAPPPPGPDAGPPPDANPGAASGPVEGGPPSLPDMPSMPGAPNNAQYDPETGGLA